MSPDARPRRGDAADYYFTYIDQVPPGNVLTVMRAQRDEFGALLSSIGAERSLHRYAPGKWSIREAVSHINDTERVFVFRALWFGRMMDSPLPSFDQDIAVAHAGADDRDWPAHVADFVAVRNASLTLFEQMPIAAWPRRGVASGHSFTVAALAHITVGHVAHHQRLLRERYLA